MRNRSPEISTAVLAWIPDPTRGTACAASIFRIVRLFISFLFQPAWPCHADRSRMFRFVVEAENRACQLPRAVSIARIHPEVLPGRLAPPAVVLDDDSEGEAAPVER